MSAPLLTSRRFLPLFAAQFLGAFTDNLFKNAALIYILFSLAEKQGLNGALLMPLAGGLFVLPYFLFSATAGSLADAIDKARLIRITKAAEIATVAIGGGALMMDSVPGMLAGLFLLGAQSTFFSPMKYAILPEALAENELVAGNALIEGGTFLAILLGTIAGGTLVLMPHGTLVVAAALATLSSIGFVAACLVPSTGFSNPSIKVRLNLISDTVATLRCAKQSRAVWLSVLGISWFWLLGSVFLTEIPSFAKDVLGGGQGLVTTFMTIFSVGVGIGSALSTRLCRGEVSARHVPLAAIGVALFGVDLWVATRHGGVGPITLARTFIDMFGLSVCGGIYAVPLYALIQSRSNPNERARVVAANNVLNAAFMVGGAAATAAILKMGGVVTDVFMAIALASTVVAAYIATILPRELFRSVTAWAFRRLFHVEVKGLEKLAAIQGPMVIVANHVSWFDGPLLNAFLPGETLFAINTHVFAKWWGGLSRFFANMLPIDPTNPMATKTMIKAVEEGKRLVIFPEGRLTKTNGLMKVYAGPAVIADKAKATVVPVKLDGVQFCKLSRLAGKMPLRWFPKITIEIQDPVRLDVPDELKGKARRAASKRRLYDVMSSMMFQTRRMDISLFQALLDARAVHGGTKGIVEDPTPDYMSRPLSYDRLVFGALMLGGKLSTMTKEGERVGVLLPNTVAAATTFFALQSAGRVPAMLNFSTGTENMLAACGAAEIVTILTSRAFVEKAKGMAEAVAALSERARVVYLEDFQTAGARRLRRLMGMPVLGWRLTALAVDILLSLRRFKAAPFTSDAPAVVLFTSGSEGTPKGVVLSHRNLLANMAQLSARIDFSGADTVLNALPVFHSFGLTGGMLLPLLSGIRVFMYVSPLHYKVVPELAYDTNATIVFATDTFLAGYAKHADDYDFYSIRYVFAGAEKVKDETRRVWAEKFGLRILEGYGATETAPVIAVNTPMHFRAGTVGRVLPGIETRLDAVPGVTVGGRLSVRGPNVMLGYLRAERPGVLESPADGWYDTGDIVDVDADGFVRIVGRAKRFVKIAGEMVSLTAVETAAAGVWPGAQVAAVGVPDAKKGEQVVLFTDRVGAVRAELLADARSRGASELTVPRTVIVLANVPLLGTGKTDYVTCQKLALTASAGAADAVAEDLS